MRAFQIVCDYLKTGATIPLFFYCFHIQRSRTDGRRVSLKQGNRKLFKAYLESVCHFKDKYILVQPTSLKAILDVFRSRPSLNEDETPQFNELGEPTAMQVAKFPFQWTSRHFEKEMGSYVWREGELEGEDLSSFATLTAFVARIPPIHRVGRGGRPVLDKNGEPMFEPGLINVQELLMSEDPVIYMGIDFIFPVCDCRLFYQSSY